MIPYNREYHEPDVAGLRDYRSPVNPQASTSAFLRALVWLTLFALIFLLGFASGTVYAAERSAHCIRSFEVRPTTMYRLRDYDIEARIRIEPHADHRAFALSFTSDVGPEGGSLRELNNVAGEISPITQDPIWFKDKPGGNYVFTLSVLGAGGKVLEQQTAVIKAAGDGDDR